MEKCRYCKAEFESVSYKNFTPHYCPHCGELLSGKNDLEAVEVEELNELKKGGSKAPAGKIYIKREEANRNINAYNEMINSGYAPSGKRIITQEEHKKLKNTSHLHDNWNKERNRLKNSTIYHNVEHYTWGFYLGTTLAGLFMITGCIYLFGWIVPFLWDKMVNKNKNTIEAIQVVKDNTTGKYGIFDNNSEVLVTPYEYDSISHRKGNDYQGIYRNYFYVYKNGKIGVADSTGKISITCELDATEGAYNGVIIMQKGDKKGLMDCYGHQIIPCEYQYVLWENRPNYNSLEYSRTYVGNIIPVKADKNSGWELYNRSGRKIRGQHYKAAIQTGDPRLIKVREIRTDYKILYGIVDESGQVVVPCKYYGISLFGNDRAWAKQNYSDSWSLITSTGERLMTLSKGITPSVFHDGMAAVTEKGKIGYCDTSGKFVIPMKYEQIRNSDGSYTSKDFYYGKARVSYNGKPGSIDKTGKFTPDSETK